MRKILLISILAMSSINASAITLEEALTSGYNHNEDLKGHRVDFLTSIESFPEALSGFMPKISVGLNSFDIKSSNRTELLGGRGQSDKYTQYRQSLVINQPLFDGWSSVAQLKAAQSTFRAARSAYYAKEQDTLLKSIETYLKCVETKEKHEISKISVKSNMTQLEAMNEKFKLGESTETEVAAAREGLATSKAKEASAYANYESSKAQFFEVFGVEAVHVQMPDAPTGLPDSLEKLIEQALAMNPYIYSASHKTKSSKSLENASKGKLLPRASLQLENARTDFSPQNATGRFDNKSTTTTLSVTVPILEKGGIEYSEVRRAKHKTRENVIALDSITKRIKSSCYGSWAQLTASIEKINATDQAVKAAEIAYDGMVQEEMLGSKTIVDVLRMEERLNQAREGRIESKKEMILFSYQIKSLVGDLTAKSLKLKVDYFNPEAEFKKIKMKVIGF